MTESKLDATLSLRRDGRSLVGRDRIELLEAVDRLGSISKAAKAVGLSYKAAWDALNAVNNLLPRPVLQRQAGGAHGGGAVVTAEGKALIAGFRLLESRLARAAAALSAQDAVDPFTLLWSLGMKTSARNAFRCVVTGIKRGPVTAEVTMRLSDTAEVTALLTSESADELGIAVGGAAIALVKASFIMLAPGAEPPRVSARNRILGTVIRREDGPINSEILLDVGEGRTLAALVTRESADQLDLRVGAPACAMFKAAHVIVAVD